MVLGKVHVGDVNTDIILTVQETVNGVNIALNLQTNPFTLLQVILSDPDSNESLHTAALVNSPGTDGKIHYLNTSSATFDESGAWKARAKVTLADGSIYTSNELIFEVLSND